MSYVVHMMSYIFWLCDILHTMGVMRLIIWGDDTDSVDVLSDIMVVM